MKILQFSLLLLIAFSGRSQDIITTIAGTGTAGYNGENIPATSAQVGNQVDDILVDDVGNVYIAESSNFRIRKIDINTGLISTIAGNGSYGYSGDGSQGSSASIQFAGGLALDTSGNLYFSDFQRIRKVNLTTGIITTIAGTGNGTFNGDGMNALATNMNPYNLFFDSSGNLVFADRVNSRIRKIDMISGLVTTLMGDGTPANSGDGGHFSSAQVNRPSYITQDNQGNFYVGSDYEYTVRKVDADTGIISTVAGNGVSLYSGDGSLATSASIRDIVGLAVDGDGNLFIGSFIGRRLRKVDANSGIISTAGGTGNFGYNGDGIDATTANLLPKGLDFDPNGNLIIVDGSGHNRIRKIELATTSTFIIPDANFAAFLDSTYPAIITNGNELDIAGAATIGGTMNVSNLGISDLTGIEFFTSLSRLICPQNNISSLDISNLNLTYLSAHSNGMTSISGLSNNTNLEELYLEANQLTDISGIASLGNLTTCYVHSNQLASLPLLSGLPNLVDFNIRSNPFPSGWTLDVSANSNLTKLQCGFTNLAAIQGLANTQLEFLECKSNQITDLSDLASLPSMKTIWAAANQLSTFPALSGFPDLEWIQLTNNPLTIGTLDVSGNPLLEYIQVSGTNLSAINGLSNCQVLYELNAQNNQLIDVSDLQSITTLHSVWLTNNQLTSLPSLSASPGLFNLTFSNNPMSNWTLDVSSNTSLRRIYGANSNLDAVIGLENLSNLTNLYLDQNNLTSLADLTNTDLFELNVQDNRLDFSDARELRIANDLPNISLFKYDNQKDFTAIDNLEGCSGQSLTISIDPQDSATSYQWFKDGNLIAGATSSQYTISSFSAADVGVYSCQSFGSALDYPSPMNFSPGISSFQSEPISVTENTTGCTFIIPDPNFAAFLTANYPSIMSNGNELDIAGAATITGKLDCGNQNISDLTGIQYFTSITQLWAVNNNLTSLDISALDLTYLRVDNNQLTSIIGLGNNTNIQFLWVRSNQLANLNGISALSQLWQMSINGNQLTSMPDMSNFPVLEECNIALNPLPVNSTIDFSQNSALRTLSAGYLNLSSITGLENTSLTYLDIRTNQISDLSNIAGLSGMKTVWAGANQLTSFPNPSNFPNLEWLQLFNNPLTIGTLDVSGNPQLKYLQVSNNNLSAITGLSNTQLLRFSAKTNNLTDLSELGQVPTLEEISVENNQLTTFPVLSNAPDLKFLALYGNPFDPWILDVSTNTSLEDIRIWQANLDGVIGLANLTYLKKFRAWDNNLTEVNDLASCLTLQEVELNGNEITELPDFSNHSSLTKFYVNQNRLDFSDAVALNVLDDLVGNFIYAPQKEFNAQDVFEGCIGQSLTLEVDPQNAATGYQWFFNNTPIAGATSSTYTISSFSTAEVGTYFCRSYGSALEYPVPMSHAPGLTEFQSEPIEAVEATVGCTFTIPDPNFAAFLSATYPSIMSNGNQLDIAGAAAVTGAMNCTNKGIADLTGIEYFPGIRNFVASRNVLTNTNGLEALVDAHTIFLDLNQLTSLPDFSAFPDLKYLRVNNNPLTNTVLDLTGNSEIRELACARSNLTQILGLGNQVHLKHFGCELNDLTNLSGIENATGLISLKCHQNQIGNLPGFSIYPDLTYLNIGNNPLPAGILDVSQNPKLRELGCDRNNITEIVGLANLTDLRHFGCQVNQLTHLNGIENATELISLKCLANQITSLPPLGTFPDLLYVNIGQNLLNLGSLDISNNTKMIEFGCSTSGITEFIGLENLYQLRNFDCSRNELTTLAGLDGMTTLRGVGANYNNLEVLPDLSSSTNLSLLRVERNNLTFEDIEPNLFVPTFTYYIQGKVSLAQNLELIQGEDLDVSIAVGGVNNVYQWFKDGVSLAGQTSDQLLITGVGPSDAGVYTLQITNTLATALTLESEAIDLTVIENRPPVAVCQNIELQADTNCSVTVTADQLDGGSSDPDGDALTFSFSQAGPFGIGTHEVTLTATDPSGASDSCLAEITVTAEPLEVLLETELYGEHPISCAGAADGAIWSTVSGGCSPFTYAWSDGSTSADVSGLPAGTYTLTITDGNGSTTISEIELTEPEALTVTIDEPNTSNLEVCAFAEANIVLGYGSGSTSLDLNASASGGNGSTYSYSWSPAANLNNSNSSSPTFTPDLNEPGCATYMFEVTATDDQGCETTQTISIDVVNVGVVKGKGKNAAKKVQICHKGKNTIEVSENAVAAHLAHGDCLGTCDDNCGSSETRIALNGQLGHVNTDNNPNLSAEIFPNPSKGKFTVLIDHVEGNAEVRLFNLSGRLMDAKTIGSSYNQEIDMGNDDLETGLYLLKIVNGNETITRKISVVK